MKKGEIYLIEFPFSDISQTKRRPALIIGDIKGKNKIFCQISTHNKLIKDYAINLKKENTKGDIRFDSFIYVDMIFSLHSDLIIKKIGEVDKLILEKVEEIVKKIFL